MSPNVANALALTAAKWGTSFLVGHLIGLAYLRWRDRKEWKMTKKPCPECNGKVWDQVDVWEIPCPVCHGEKEITVPDVPQATSEAERWFADTFYREGPDLIIGPVRGRHAFDREHVDVLLRGLAEIRDVLPTLEQRLAGLSTCEACEGSGTIHDVDNATEADCPTCDGVGFAPRKEEDF